MSIYERLRKEYRDLMNEPVRCLFPAEMVKKKGISITETGLCPVDYEPSAWQFKHNSGHQETIQQDILDFENLHSKDGKLLIIIPCESQRLRLLIDIRKLDARQRGSLSA
jgi:hypothetical protein